MAETASKPDSRCSVCFDEKFWKENPLVNCNNCNLTVHQACYGIPKIPDSSWLCQTCESQERMARVKCELCPLKGGALKRTDTNGWAHVVCALYIPEVRFADTRTMEPIIISRIPRDKFTKSCHICEEGNQERNASYGACMTCNWASCKISFHVTCAQKFGLLTEEDETRDGSSVRYCGYCPTHLTRIALNDRRKTIGLTATSIHTSTNQPQSEEKGTSIKRKLTPNNDGGTTKRPVLTSDSSCSSHSEKNSDSDSTNEGVKKPVKIQKKTTNKKVNKQNTSQSKSKYKTETKQKQISTKKSPSKTKKPEIIKSKVHPLSRQLSKNYSQTEAPDSLEKMLDKQWKQTSEYIFDQSSRLGEIDTLLTSLHRLQNENNELKNSMQTLSIKTDRYQSSNLYLSSLLTMHAVGQISSKIPHFKPPEIMPPKPSKPRKRISKTGELNTKLIKRKSKKKTNEQTTNLEVNKEGVTLGKQENEDLNSLPPQIETETETKQELTPEV